MMGDVEGDLVDDEGEGTDMKGNPFPMVTCPFCGLTKSAGLFYAKMAGAELYCPECGSRAR